MIFIALGANLPGPAGTPAQTLEAAKRFLAGKGIAILRESATVMTAPVPQSDQPDYANAVIAVETDLEPCALLDLLKAAERHFGRRSAERNAPRALDLDILDYHGRVMESEGLTLPHPRLRERGFVLYPLRQIAPGWRDPVSGLDISALIHALPADHRAEAA